MALPSLSRWQICRARSLDVIQLRRQDILFTNHLDTFFVSAVIQIKKQVIINILILCLMWYKYKGKFNSNHQSSGYIYAWKFKWCYTNTRQANLVASPIIWKFVWWDTNTTASSHLWYKYRGQFSPTQSILKYFELLNMVRISRRQDILALEPKNPGYVARNSWLYSQEPYNVKIVYWTLLRKLLNSTHLVNISKNIVKCW